MFVECGKAVINNAVYRCKQKRSMTMMNCNRNKRGGFEAKLRRGKFLGKKFRVK